MGSRDPGAEAQGLVTHEPVSEWLLSDEHLLCARSYVLFMLPRLTSLDTLLLAEETKQLAEATFLKKQVG